MREAVQGHGRTRNMVRRNLAVDDTAYWRDSGCDLFASCLSCPLPRCRYELPPKQAHTLVRLLTATRLARDGLTREEIARRMHVSQRTVSRLLAAAPRWKDWLDHAVPLLPA